MDIVIFKKRAKANNINNVKVFFHLIALYHDKNTSKHVITYIGRNIIKHGIISLDITLQNLEFTAKKKINIKVIK